MKRLVFSLVFSLGMAFAREASADAPPDDPDREMALALGEHRLLHGDLQSAARQWLVFAERWPADVRTKGALRDAMTIERSLGDKALLDATLAEFERLYAASSPADWAEVVYAQSAYLVERGDAQAGKSLLLQLQERGKSLPPSALKDELQLRTLVRLARLQQALGEAKPARAALASAKALVGKLGIWPWKGKAVLAAQSKDALDCIAEIFFLEAEESRAKAERIALEPFAGKGDRESIIAYLEGPAAKWLEKRREAMEDAERAYLRLWGIERNKPKPSPPPSASSGIGLGGDPNAPLSSADDDPWNAEDAGTLPPSPAFAIAAARRIGEGYSSVAHQIRVMPYPSAWQVSPAIRGIHLLAFTPIDSPSELLRARSREALDLCMRLGIRHRIVNEHTRACEMRLAKERPWEYFTLSELNRPASWESVGIVTEPERLSFFMLTRMPRSP